MADLILSGNLDLAGRLDLLTTGGGKVKVDGDEVLVPVEMTQDPVQGRGVPPVLQPPPPASPLDPGTDVKVIRSFNSTVTANGKAIVAMGVCMQGGKGSLPNQLQWPGIVLQSEMNSRAVRINSVPINVKGDSGVTLPNGGTVKFDKDSGQ